MSRLRSALLVAAAAWGAACPGGDRALPLAGTASEGVVFARRTERGSDLFRLRVADGAVSPIRVAPDREERWPYWSQGAGRLLFQSRAAADVIGHRLLLLDPATGRTRRLTTRDAAEEHWPAWSPDGSRVAFAFRGRAGPGPADGLGEIELATGRFTLLGSQPFYRPEYGPAGRRLVAQRSDGEGTSRLWLLRRGAAPRPLTGAEGWFEQKGRFTRDGRIVYTRRRDTRSPGDLLLVNDDGADARVLVGAPRAHDHTGAPSPTRDEVAFVSNRGGSADAYLVPLAGGFPRRLTRTPERDESALHWSPDGERLAITARVPGGTGDAPPAYRVLVVDRAGRILADVPGMMPDWMPAW